MFFFLNIFAWLLLVIDYYGSKKIPAKQHPTTRSGKRTGKAPQGKDDDKKKQDNGDRSSRRNNNNNNNGNGNNGRRNNKDKKGGDEKDKGNKSGGNGSNNEEKKEHKKKGDELSEDPAKYWDDFDKKWKAKGKLKLRRPEENVLRTLPKYMQDIHRFKWDPTKGKFM